MTLQNRDIARGIRYLMKGSVRQRYNAFLNIVVERQRQATVLSSLPVVIQVEPTNRCNLRCEMCSRLYSKLELGDITEETCARVKSLMPYASELYLFGCGESLLNSAFHTFLKLAARSLVSVHFSTNGLLIDNEMANEICAKKVATITFSIDGATKETYEKIRRGADFDKLIQNIIYINNLKKNGHRKIPKLQVEFVAMRSNIEELPELVKLASSLGIQRIKVTHLVVWGERLRNESLLYHPKITSKMFDIARDTADKLAITLDLPHNFNEDDGFQPHKTSQIPKCYFPWCYTYIKYDGEVRGCCFTDNFVMGNVNEKPFKEIWNDRPYQDLRGRVNSPNPPSECMKCDYRWRYLANSASKDMYIRLDGRSK